MYFKIIVIPIVLASILALDSFFVLGYKDDSEITDSINISSEKNLAYILPVNEPNYLPILNLNIKRPIIDAKAALVYDYKSSKVLYEKNISEQLPIASLTKILSAMIVLDNFNLDEVVSIGKSSIRVDGEKQDLYVDEQITVENLLMMMLIESSNDAAYALANYSEHHEFNFIERMNNTARSLGMMDSLFLDPAGLNDLAYSSADDLLKLIIKALEYDFIWDSTLQNEVVVESINEGVKHNLLNTNKLLGVIDGINGGKTGYTDAALGCMILIFNVTDYPSDIVSIVIGSQDRFRDTTSLIDWIKLAYIWK
jgi:serine-type D-Ala-D-Ala carboxypeptidase (penicillin-binding protein 5/6)